MPKNDSNGNDTLAAPASSVDYEALGLEPGSVAADDPAITGVPRDETHDSIEPNTGTLTAEATARRAELASDR